MKEAIYSPYPKLLFRETFRDEATVRKNGGIPTNVTFSEGKGTFNGTSSKINYNLNLNGTYSVRIRCNPTSFADNRSLFDFRGSNNDGTGYMYLDTTTGTILCATGTDYVNGVQTSATTAGVNNEIVISGISLMQGTGANLSLIGSRYLNDDEFLGTIDLLEIYQGTLTASQVANLYNNTWNRELPPTNVLLNFDSTGGVIRLGDLGATSTITAVTAAKQGALFNGSTSNISFGTDPVNTKAITGMHIFKPTSLASDMCYYSNGKYQFFVLSNGGVKIQRDGSTNALSATGIIKANGTYGIAYTSTSAGVTNIYFTDLSSGLAISGSADQSAGTPASGTTNLILGASVGSRYNGLVKKDMIVEGVLSLADMTRWFTSNLWEIN